MFISLSQPELITNKYSGNKGCYACAQLDEVSKVELKKLANYLGYDSDGSKFHITLVYSKEPLNTKEFPFNNAFDAYVGNISHFTGHDGKEYLVANIVSETALLVHSWLLQRGAVHSFTPYTPHITLYSDITVNKPLIKKIDVLNKRLAIKPLKVTFVDSNIFDLKD